MHINPRQLEAFRLVMLSGSATAAGRDLGISQPAVSRLIRDLETNVGLALFERRANLLVPTPEASLLLSEVERYANGLSAIAAFATELRDRRRGALRVVAMPALAMGFVPRYLAGFIAGRALTEVYVHGMPSHLIIDAVMSGQADIGIVAAPPERPGLSITPIKTRAVVAVPAGHRLAKRRRVHTKDLVDERVIALSETPTLFYAGTSPFAAIRNKVVTTPLSGIACALVSEGVGIALIDPFSVADYLDRGVVAIPLHPAVEIRIAIVTNQQRSLSVVSKEFLEGFKAHSEAHTAWLTMPSDKVSRSQKGASRAKVRTT